MITARIEGPFDIRPTNCILKPAIRLQPVVGPWVADAVADESLQVIVDGSGLADRNNDRLLEHTARKEAMRLIPQAQAAKGLVFDLNGVYTLESLQIWNYNEPGYTERGVAQADVSVWTAEGGWKTVLRQAKLNEAEGTDDYDEPTLLTFAPIRAQKVRLENLSPFVDEGFVGLSAIRFYEQATFAACNPQPAVDAQLPCTEQISLVWTPGKEAVACDIYAAPEGEALMLLGRIAQNQVNLAGLAGGKRYVWRADQVRQDGSVTAGPEWAFTMNKGRCVGQWSFSEGGGTVANDVSGCDNSGTVYGSPSWVAGKYDSAIDFDGSDNYVSVADSNSIRVGRGDYTISAWIYPRSTSGWHGIVTKVKDGMQKEYAWGLDNGALTLEVEVNANNGRAATAPVIAADRWQHVVVVFDSTATNAKFYIDGQLQEVVSDTITALPINFNDHLCIGGWGGNYNSRYFEGIIDDVCLFSYALSDDQVAALAAKSDAGLFTADATSKLTLAGAELLERNADLKAVAETQTRAAEGDAVDAPRRNLLPVLAIVAVIVIVVVILRKKKTAA